MARLLIVEDEPLIAMMLEDFAELLGHNVAATTDSVAGGLDATGRGGFDAAILDISLKQGESCWPLADALAEAGTPFVLASGGRIEEPPERHGGRIRVDKPYTLEGVREALETALAE